jgi:hypothetical protein
LSTIGGLSDRHQMRGRSSCSSTHFLAVSGARWFTTVYGGDPESTALRRMSVLATGMGGHIRTGFRDVPVHDGVAGFANADHVKLAAEMALLAGREMASPAVARHPRCAG